MSGHSLALLSPFLSVSWRLIDRQWRFLASETVNSIGNELSRLSKKKKRQTDERWTREDEGRGCGGCAWCVPDRHTRIARTAPPRGPYRCRSTQTTPIGPPRPSFGVSVAVRQRATQATAGARRKLWMGNGGETPLALPCTAAPSDRRRSLSLCVIQSLPPLVSVAPSRPLLFLLLFPLPPCRRTTPPP